MRHVFEHIVENNHSDKAKEKREMLEEENVKKASHKKGRFSGVFYGSKTGSVVSEGFA